MLYHDLLTNNFKLIHKPTCNIPVYEKHFAKFRNQAIVFWEIGVGKGGSLQMWKRFLGPFAHIVGIDINPDCKVHEEDRISVCIGDQSDTAFLQEVIDKYGLPNIVLDDGSHIMKDVCATWDFLYDKLPNNSVYMVEDIATAYWESYGGGFKREGTFIEKCKSLIDSINAQPTRNNFADTTHSMTFYTGSIVFDKMNFKTADMKGIEVPPPAPCKVNVEGAKDAISRGIYSGRVYLYGAGGHTIELLDTLGNEWVSKLTAILTNEQIKNKMFSTGNSKVKIENIETLVAGDTIIVSSMIYQDTIFKRIRHLMEIGVNVVKLY